MDAILENIVLVSKGGHLPDIRKSMAKIPTALRKAMQAQLALTNSIDWEADGYLHHT